MSLTVPAAGVSAGRAAQPQFETPQTGSAFAQFGDALKGLGDKMEARRLDNEMGQLQLGMTRDLNGLRLKYEGMGDPDAINAGWSQDIAALRQKYATGKGETGRPLVDPKIADQFHLAFDDLTERHAFALGTNVLALQQSQRVATHMAYEAEAAQTAATTDAGTRQTIFEQYGARVDALIADGTYTPEQGQKAKLDFQARGDSNAAFQMLAVDPQGLIDHLDAGELTSLSPEDRQTYLAKAQNALTLQAEKAAKEADAQAAQVQAAQKSAIADGLAIMSKGEHWQNEAMLDDPTIQQTFPDLVAEARGAQSLRDDGKNILQMTPAELQAERDRISGSGFAKDWQTNRLAALDKRLAQATTDWAKDPIAAAKAADLPVPDLAPFDPSNPDGFVKSLQARTAFAGWVEKRGYAKDIGLLSEQERAELKAGIGIDANPAARAALAVSLVNGAGPRADGLAQSAGASTTFQFAMGLLGQGRSPVLAEAMLRGEAKRDKKTVVLPAEKDLRLSFDQVTGGMFGQDVNANAQLLDAASALYADSATGLDPEAVKSGSWGNDDAAKAVFETAVQQVLGATPDASGEYSVGGVQIVADHPVLLPPGLSRDAAESAWANLGKQLHGRVWDDGLGDWPRGGATADPLRGLKAAAIDGSAPDLGPDPAALFRSGLVPEAFGPDRYVLTYERNGQKVIVENTDGGSFVFSMRKLPQAVSR